MMAACKIYPFAPALGLPIPVQWPTAPESKWESIDDLEVFDIDMNPDTDVNMGICEETGEPCKHMCKCRTTSCKCTWARDGRACCSFQWRERLSDLKKVAPKTNGKIYCYGCNKPIDPKKVFVGHIKPACDGGEFAMHNLRLTCSTCEHKNGNGYLTRGKFT